MICSMHNKVTFIYNAIWPWNNRQCVIYAAACLMEQNQVIVNVQEVPVEISY